MRSDILAFATPAALFLVFLSFSFPISGANPNIIMNSDEDIEAGEFCLDCHDIDELALPGTAHEPIMLAHQIEISCISCHSGAAVHVEDPTVDNIGNPANLKTGEVLGVCTQCHQPHMELDNIGFDVHTSEGLSCLSCHSIHGGQEKLLVDDKLQFCSECHTAVANQFIKTSNHPLLDGAVSCISCHDFTGKLQPAFAHGASANCASCHPMQGGPFLYEHEPTSSFSTEGEGCVACHMPHGSSNDRLLTRPSNNLLCKQCHGTPARHINLPSGHDLTLSSYNCIECHSAVHGSNDNRNFLDPNLGAKVGSGPGSCFCHNVSG